MKLYNNDNPKIINFILTAIVVALLILIVYKSKQPHKVKVGQVWFSVLENDFYKNDTFLGRKNVLSYDSVIAIDGLQIIYINLNSGDTMRNTEKEFLKFNKLAR